MQSERERVIAELMEAFVSYSGTEKQIAEAAYDRGYKAGVEDAAKVVCPYCRGDEQFGLPSMPARWFEGAQMWRHQTARQDIWATCEAAAIRSLAEGEGHDR